MKITYTLKLWLAVLASGVVGAAVDSAVFLQLAFGGLDHFSGQIVGKVWMSALAVLVLIALKHSSVSNASSEQQ
jgi:queuosine precursor transporter